MDSLFQIVVQVFIRVQFGSIGRKIKDSDLALMCFKPLGYILAVVDSEVIEDEIDFLFYVFHESGLSGQTQLFLTIHAYLFFPLPLPSPLSLPLLMSTVLFWPCLYCLYYVNHDPVSGHGILLIRI